MADSYWQRRLLKSRRALDKSTINIIQNPLGITGGIISDAVKTVNSGEILEGTNVEGFSLASGLLSYTKYWRYKLLFKRSNLEQSQYNPRPKGVLATIGLIPGKEPDEADHYHSTRPYHLSTAERNSPEVDKIRARRAQREEYKPVGRSYILNRLAALEKIPKGRLNDIFIINASVSPYYSIKLQNRPDSLEINPHGNWVSVASMGRNNPFMMYTGGEDTISFEISWYANDPARREEVITKCRLLESWSKADGYFAAPPILRILWGTSGLFDDQYFILESATYNLSHFQDRSLRDAKAGYQGGVRDLHLYPNCATQQLTFKRVTSDNVTHRQIVDLSEALGTHDIGIAKIK